jgi:hypothetical protein
MKKAGNSSRTFLMNTDSKRRVIPLHVIKVWLHLFSVWSLHAITLLPSHSSRCKRVYLKYSGLVPPSIQQLWKREGPVDGRTTVTSESVCQVARSWVDVGSFDTRLVVRFMIFTASVRNIVETPSYPWGRTPRLTLKTRVGGPQGRCGILARTRIFCPYRKSNPESSSS